MTTLTPNNIVNNLNKNFDKIIGEAIIGYNKFYEMEQLLLNNIQTNSEQTSSISKKAIAFLLTGMGSDGARELKELRTAGALTIAQDRDSSIVFGMPGVAIKLDAAELVMNTNDIRDFLTEMEQFHKTGENLKKL